eukprot:TRINITY_DN51567_c0_g1_i1.p1 TRINITY_DN51567_c0_g1~~TRINITY_DN51567_c0_g1_i1.p1  ORF type:complete len:113 (+),score=20.14 TRINITY_DN51567_c0_g1_i1:69-407(+)
MNRIQSLSGIPNPFSVNLVAVDVKAFKESCANANVDFGDVQEKKFASGQTSPKKMESSAKHTLDMLLQDLATQADHTTADSDPELKSEDEKRRTKVMAEGELTDAVTTRGAN